MIRPEKPKKKGARRHHKITGRFIWKLTPEVHKKIVDLVRLGNYMETAAPCVGVTSRTVRNWIMWGLRDPDGEYGQFARDITEAEADAEARSVYMLQKAAPEDWRAAAHYLERRNPNKWGRRSAVCVEVSRGIESILDAVEQHMSAEAYDELLGALAAVGGVDSPQTGDAPPTRPE